MILINPQPEPNPIREYGFTREEFSLFLLADGFLQEGDIVHSWKITDRDFFAFNVIRRVEEKGFPDQDIQTRPRQKLKKQRQGTNIMRTQSIWT